VIAPLWLRQFDGPFVSAARGLLLFLPLMTAAPLLTGALEVDGRFGTANQTLYVQSLFTLALIGGLWWLGMLDPVRSALCYLLPAIPAAVFFWWQLRGRFRPSLDGFGAVSRRLLHYGLRFYGVDVLATVTTYTDQLLLVALLAPGLVGNYVLALSLSRVLGVLQGAITTVLFPRIAGRPTTEIVETVARTLRVTIPVSLLAAAALGLVGPPLVRLLYGRGFEGAITPFGILLLDSVVANAGRVMYQVFSGSGRPGVVTTIEAVTAGVAALAMWLVVPVWGIVGAACCVLAASTVRLVAATACIRWVHGARLSLLPARPPRAERRDPAHPPQSIGVLICTYQRPESLARGLAGLAAQQRRPDEVIVVVRGDDGPTRRLLGTASPLLRGLGVREIVVGQPGTVHALNAGLAACRTDVLAITDDDTVPHPDWLARILAHFQADPALGALGGRDRCHDGTRFDERRAPEVGRIRWFGRMIGNHHAGEGPVRDIDYLKGANMSYRSVACAGVRFDPRLKGIGAQPGEDGCFSLAVARAGWRVRYDPEVLVDHYAAPRDDRFYGGVAPVTDARGYQDFAYNSVVVLWDAYPAWQQAVFFVWSVLVGSSLVPGLVQAIRFTPSLRGASWRRFVLAQQGRLAAYADLIAQRPARAAVPARAAGDAGRRLDQAPAVCEAQT
jgi:GT2 family glycosyltransferase